MKTSAGKFFTHFGFWLAALVMVMIGWTLYGATQNGIESSRLVSHTQDVLQSLAEINDVVSRAESAQRGYLISGNDAFLSERDKTIEKVNDAVARVKALTSDNPVQQRQLTKLEILVASRVAIMQRNALLRRAGGMEAAKIFVGSGVGQQASVKIYDLTAEMKQEELKLLALRRADAERRHNIELAVLIGAVLIGVLVLIPGYLGLALQTRARQRTERNLRVMADSLPGAMYQLRLDSQGTQRLTFLSDGVSRVFGAGVAGALPGWDSLVNAIDERDRPGFVAALAEATKSLGHFQRDYRVGHNDGALRWLHHEASLQQEADGSILVNGYIADISRQELLKVALLEAKQAADLANRAKSTFLATMSHEIRTPMNAMFGMLELVSLTKLDGDQRTKLGLVREAGKSLLRIIDDVLDFSKIEAGKLEVRPEIASIEDVIQDVHNIYTGNASSKGVLIKHSADPQISPALLVDPVRLRQILNNCVSNAVKFTPRGGTIEVRAELIERANGEDRVRFSVKDSGIGVSAEAQQRLFQPFSQGETDTARRYGGTGLGLTICRRLAEMMGGTVEMESEPGKGTTMIVVLSLPIADPSGLRRLDFASARDTLSSATNMRRMAPSVADAEAEGTLVLLVDDHPTNRTLMMRQLHALGYAAESVENGVKALEAWQSGRFGIVITDCNMPEMDGYELTRSIRRLEAASLGKRTPIIAFTANALGGEAEICYEAGMDDCLVKPVQLPQILEKLGQWLPIPDAAAMRSAASGDNPDAASAAAPIDRAVLGEISGGNVANERDILIDFRRVNDEDAAMLKRAVATNDIPQVTRASHRIKGASKMIGAMVFADVCERIEQASRASDWPAVTGNMGAFHQEWVRLNAHLDSF